MKSQPPLVGPKNRTQLSILDQHFLYESGQSELEGNIYNLPITDWMKIRQNIIQTG